MEFNKERDDIAITIPEFKLHKRGDPFGKSEIGIVTMAVDAEGVANPAPSLFTNTFFIPKVKNGQTVKFGGQGRLVYGPKNPGSFVYYNILFVECDQDVRDFGSTVTNVFESQEAKQLISVLTLANPAYSIVSSVVMELGKLAGKMLAKNKNDLLYSTEGSFLQHTVPPYNIGDESGIPGSHITCQVKVVPLVKVNDGIFADTNGESDYPLHDTLTSSSTGSLLMLEKLAGEPKVYSL